MGLTFLALAILGACEPFPAAPTPAPAEKAAPAIARNIDALVEAELTAIPPQLRSAHQQALACDVKRNNAARSAKAIAVTREYLRDLLARLKADPGIARC